MGKDDTDNTCYRWVSATPGLAGVGYGHQYKACTIKARLINI